MKKLLFIVFATLFTVSLYAQADKREVRSGNRFFGKGKYAESEIEYRKAVLIDTLSIAGQYNLASALYKQQNYEEAAQALGKTDEQVAYTPFASAYYFNEGDVALQRKDYSAAVKAFRQSLLRNPGDLAAKENYLYAKEMLKTEQNQGGGDGDGQSQDNGDQNQQNQQNQNDQNQDNGGQNQPQPKDEQKPQEQPGQDNQEGGISQQQARQMLRAVQAEEKKTQEKVNKEKAELLKSSQKEKNW